MQLHGILKSHIKPTISDFNLAKLDSIAACGDVNRNVTCSAHPNESEIHEEVFAFAENNCLSNSKQLYVPHDMVAFARVLIDQQSEHLDFTV